MGGRDGERRGEGGMEKGGMEKGGMERSCKDTITCESQEKHACGVITHCDHSR